MQRKDIKIGEAYAVTSERGKRRHSADKVKATVVRLDAEYEKRSGSYSSRTYTAKDGILVRFDEPVVLQNYGINTLASLIGKGSQYTAQAQKNFRDRAITEWVIGDARFVMEKWDDYEARQKEISEIHERRARETDEQAAAFEPVLQETMEKLREIGFENVSVHTDASGISFKGGSIALYNSTGTDGEKKPTGFGHNARITTDALLNLIGMGEAVTA